MKAPFYGVFWDTKAMDYDLIDGVERKTFDKKKRNTKINEFRIHGSPCCQILRQNTFLVHNVIKYLYFQVVCILYTSNFI